CIRHLCVSGSLLQNGRFELLEESAKEVLSSGKPPRVESDDDWVIVAGINSREVFDEIQERRLAKPPFSENPDDESGRGAPAQDRMREHLCEGRVAEQILAGIGSWLICRE